MGSVTIPPATAASTEIPASAASAATLATETSLVDTPTSAGPGCMTRMATFTTMLSPMNATTPAITAAVSVAASPVLSRFGDGWRVASQKAVAPVIGGQIIGHEYT